MMNERLKKFIFAEIVGLVFCIVLGVAFAYFAPERLCRYIMTTGTIFLLWGIDSYYWYIASSKWPDRSRINDSGAAIFISVVIVGSIFLLLWYFYPEYAWQYIERLAPMTVGYLIVRLLFGRPIMQW